MHKLVALLAAIVLGLALSSPVQSADTYVRGYYKHDGTYVQPHYRTRPDGNIYNNYSTYPNVNPYTGRRGTVNPYSTYSNPYSSPYSSPYSNPYGTRRRY